MTTPKDADLPSTTVESTAPPQPPTQVVASFWILLVSAALRLVIVVITLASWNSVVNTLLQQPRPANTTLDQARSTIHQYLIVNLALDVVFALVYVLFAFMVRSGRNWARLTITVIVALFAIFGLLNGADLYTLISVLIELVAVGLLYMRPAKEFFAAVKAAAPSRFRR